jgi:hypothetical protein
MPEHGPLQASNETTLAAAIIDIRDSINALFHERHNEKLLLLNSERDLLQMFRMARSEEEFRYRVCALSNICSELNVGALRKSTGNADSQAASIGLLEEYLAANTADLKPALTTFRAIRSLRKAFPIHNDNATNVLRAYKQLGIPYPLSDYATAWAHLLQEYLAALRSLLEALEKGRQANPQKKRSHT